MVQKGEPIFLLASLPVNSLWVCDITKIEVAEQYSQFLGIATEWNVKFASAAVLYKMAPIEKLVFRGFIF